MPILECETTSRGLPACKASRQRLLPLSAPREPRGLAVRIAVTVAPWPKPRGKPGGG